ncbi:MAG: heme lyase CcmF/NrfE family subunit [Planctomycetota bacterium]|jgi:cytochrome c-type biogenesis protein CcmF
MAELGHFALMISLFVSGYAVLVDLLGWWRAEAGLMKSGRNATVACWLCLSVAMVSLVVALVRQDFSVRYVAEHTARALPLLYKISALWAGAAGSLLLWLWLQVGFVAIVFARAGRRDWRFAAAGRAMANFVSVFFLIVLTIDSSPFSLSGRIPDDGGGLNPLLQHPAMALHPPTLFIGYAALIIPFAWAFAELGCRAEQKRHPLFVQARNWAMIGWLFLTIGIVLGAWWAYEELGWGGYWAWDPVENSSLLPWLTATALLHCFRTYKPGSAIALWLTVLSLVSFSLCVFGTFLTRYGLVSSIHAFPEPGLGILFMYLIVAVWAVAGVLLWAKHKGREGPLLQSPLAGAKFIAVNNCLMVLLTLVILYGTLYPFFSGLFATRKTLKAEFFTKVTGPPGLVLLLLLCVCPYLLRRGITHNWRIFGTAIFTAAALVAWFLTKSLAIPCFIICGFGAVNLGAEFFARGAGSRKTLRWYGARIAHTGVVVIFVGIAASGAYDVEKQAALTIGKSMTAGRFKITFDNLGAEHGANFVAVTADVSVYRMPSHNDPNEPGTSANDQQSDPQGVLVARLRPSQAHYLNSDQTTSEVDVRRTLGGDLYVALTAVDSAKELINLRVLVKPLINWIWIGSTALVVGALLVLISFYRRRRAV